MNRLEEILHQSISEKWNNSHRKGTPQYEDRQRLICHWNNGESKRSGNKMMVMGVKRGVSDWQYLMPLGEPTKWIELKVGDNVQSEDQVRFERMVVALGHEYYICRDEETFWNIIGWHPPFTPHLNQ